jgi:hippurate hydrolase
MTRELSLQTSKLLSRLLPPAETQAFIDIRRQIHAEPELGYEEHATSDAGRRAAARAGATRCTPASAAPASSGSCAWATAASGWALRADMDALPMTETTGLPWASRTPGRMHACGHDGHTATLLAAAQLLAVTRGFDGTLNLIFQPAEENL